MQWNLREKTALFWLSKNKKVRILDSGYLYLIVMLTYQAHSLLALQMTAVSVGLDLLLGYMLR